MTDKDALCGELYKRMRKPRDRDVTEREIETQADTERLTQRDWERQDRQMKGEKRESRCLRVRCKQIQFFKETDLR